MCKRLISRFPIIGILGIVIISGCKQSEQKGDSNVDSTTVVSENNSILKAKADILYGKDRFDEATVIYQKLIKEDSMNGELFFKYGYCNSRLNRDSVAIECFQRAAELNHRVFECYRNIAIIFFMTDEKKAKIYFEKCLELDKDNPEIKKFLRHINRSKESV